MKLTIERDESTRGAYAGKFRVAINDAEPVMVEGMGNSTGWTIRDETDEFTLVFYPHLQVVK